MDQFFVNHTWSFVRQAILSRDKYKCGICEKRKKRKELEVDHIIPVRAGIDPFEKNNLRLLCKECHRAKGKLERTLF